jgi:NTP pyrophosphatase (non-canonical NTP hydrolase)
MDFELIIQEVRKERIRQLDKWGDQKHPLAIWLTILAEEFGEVAKAILEGNIAEVRTELIQVIAVGFAFLEDDSWM